MSRKQSLFSSLIVLYCPTYSHAQLWSGIISPAPPIDWIGPGTGEGRGLGPMIKRVLCAALFLLLCSAAGHAACRGSGTVWSCPAGASSSDVQAAINSASDGAVITLAAGSYTVTSQAKFSNSKGATIICATPPLAVGAATVNPCIMNGVGPVFGSDTFGGTNTHFYRISGFTFDLQGSKPTTGTLYWDSYNGTHNATLTQVRVDHNTFRNGTTGAQTTLIGSGGQIMEVYGVYDHNFYTNATQFTMVIWIGAVNPSPPAQQIGTGNNLFMEDNTMSFTTVGNASAEGCTDSWGGAALVARHNTSTNCLWATHGVTHAGGPANYEFYNNVVKMDAGAIAAGTGGCYRCFHHQGSGTVIGFNNTFTPSPGQAHQLPPFSVAHYRDYTNSVDGGLPICDGTNVTPPALDGNRAPIATNRGYPCWNQPGRVFGPMPQALFPMYAWNNTWTDDGTQAPISMEDFGGFSSDYHAQHMQNDRELENAVSVLAQTSPTSPFNGTTGMGFGTLANRPTTCSTFSEAGSGVGYFATDVGAQGTLFRCSATNTWTVQYTPYTYPHPLVTRGGDGGPAAPTNLLAVPN